MVQNFQVIHLVHLVLCPPKNLNVTDNSVLA